MVVTKGNHEGHDGTKQLGLVDVVIFVFFVSFVVSFRDKVVVSCS